MHEERKMSLAGMKRKLHGRARAPFLTVAALLLVAITLDGCCSTSTRSVASYCQTFYQQGTQLRNGWQSADDAMSQDPLGGLITVAAVPSQLATFFGQLDSVAPQSIEPDVSQIQQALQQEVNNAGQDITNPISGLIGGLASSIETAPAWAAVNNWTDSHCGPPPGAKWLNAITP